ncbi:MAG: RES family NAD+ phosphorylase [Catalinimonas sp.]
MRLYRLAKTAYVRDLQGTGCLYFGGRWHRQGTRILYTSESASLAILEVLANTRRLPVNYAILVLEVPDPGEIDEVDLADIPPDWNHLPYPDALADLTEAWVASERTYLRRVPSVHSPLEHNVLLNPQHPDHARTRIVSVLPYRFDARLKA